MSKLLVHELRRLAAKRMNYHPELTVEGQAAEEIESLRDELAGANKRIEELGDALELLAEGVVGRPMTAEQRIARRALEGGE